LIYWDSNKNEIKNLNMPERKKNNRSIDFRWIFIGETELYDTAPFEDDRKDKAFLKKTYKSSTNKFMLLKKDEIEFLKNIYN
jgi:hypothetical protein